MIIYVRGASRSFEARRAPFDSVAGNRFMMQHEGAMTVAATLGAEALPPGVLGELMRLLYDGDHDGIDWERDISRLIVSAMLVRAAVGMGGTLPAGSPDEIEIEASETEEIETAASVAAATLEG